jgi:hypothetical protein
LFSSQQQWQLFFSSMADMLAALRSPQASSAWQLWLFSPRSNDNCSSAAWQICMLLFSPQESSSWHLWLLSPCSNDSCSSAAWQICLLPVSPQEKFIIMAVVAVLSWQQWQLFFSSMKDILAARQHAGEFIVVDLAVLSSQQWTLFFSSMADMPAARQSASRRVHHGCGYSSRNGSCSQQSQQHCKYVLLNYSSCSLSMTGIAFATIVLFADRSPVLHIIIEVLNVTRQLFSWNYNNFSE